MLEKSKYISLALLMIAAVPLIVFETWLVSSAILLLFAVSLYFVGRVERLRFVALMLGILIVAATPVNTDLDNAHFAAMVVGYLCSLLVPYLFLRIFDKGVVTLRLFPEKWRRADVVHTIVNIVGSSIGVSIYLKVLNKDVLANWPLPFEPQEGIIRLFVGMYLTGFWDEAYNLHTNLAILSSMFHPIFANIAQSFIYLSSLWDLAFRGIGFPFMALFALTQGLLWLRSRALFWVLVVHFTVELVVFRLIIQAQYPELNYWWLQGNF